MGKIHSQRRTFFFVALATLAVLGVATAAALFLSEKTVSGQVVDSATGRPLAGAVVEVAGREVRAGDDGSFTLSGVRFGTTLAAEAQGHQPVSTVVDLSGRVRLALAPRVLEGAVVDASTGQPVPGVQVAAGRLASQSDQQGRFQLAHIDPGIDVVARAEGYAPAGLRYEGQATANLAMNPNVLAVRVLNRYTGGPVEGVEVGDGRTMVHTDAQGQARLSYLRDGAEVALKREGFAPSKLAFAGQGAAEVVLRPDAVAGVIKDSRGRPVAGASVSDGNTTVTADGQGNFRLSGLPENARLTVSASGYERQQLELGQRTSLDVALKPFAARGLYLTYYGIGSDELRDHVLELADRTEVNAVVIDIKGDRGWLAYRSSVPMVKEIGAQQEITIPDARKLLADLKQRGVYTIARIVTFKDNPLATARPDLAVINAETGEPWVDNEGLRWTDPTRAEVWDYNIALAVEAIENGFDEVQFDYVRFPTDASAGNSLDSITFSQPNTMANRTAAISAFLERARGAIKAKGGNLSADIFGYVVWRDDDMGIGQHLEDLARHVDYVSPMVYPNLFWDGILVEGGEKYGNQQAGLYPYEIVYESMKIAVDRIGAEKLRPWLQYYNDYLTGKTYTADDIEAQKKATYDNGITGWMFWDPSNRFAKGGFGPEQ